MSLRNDERERERESERRGEEVDKEEKRDVVTWWVYQYNESREREEWAVIRDRERKWQKEI